MSGQPENPQAFPRTGEGFGNPKYDAPGMTLRDWFAGQALVGLCANRTLVDGGEDAQFKAAVWSAYCMADDMLAERAKAGAL